MKLTIPIAHDFNCPWCYVATHQVDRLQREFDGLEFEWRGYELWPAELERPLSPPRMDIPNKPLIPSRLDLMLVAEDMELPSVERPKLPSTHPCHLAAEFAKEQGHGGIYVRELYRAYWERGEFIAEVQFLVHLGEKLGMDPVTMRESIESDQFAERIVHFDAPSYKTGIFNVPTFWIGDKRYAEQPYKVLSAAVAETLESPR